jgi:hypothetical protein
MHIHMHIILGSQNKRLAHQRHPCRHPSANANDYYLNGCYAASKHPRFTDAFRKQWRKSRAASFVGPGLTQSIPFTASIQKGRSGAGRLVSQCCAYCTTNLGCGLICKVKFATRFIKEDVNPGADEREPHLFGNLNLRPPSWRSLLLLTQL